MSPRCAVRKVGDLDRNWQKAAVAQNIKDEWAGFIPLTPNNQQQELELALQNRLEATAELHGKSSGDVALAKAKIWCALTDRQAALGPSIGTQLRTKRAIRDWRLGRDWANPEHNSRINSDWAAKLVRFESLRPKCSEQRAIKAAGRISEKDLDAIERTALDIVMGKRGLTRLHTDSRNPGTQAAHLARAVRAGWLPPEPALRLIKPEKATPPGGVQPPSDRRFGCQSAWRLSGIREPQLWKGLQRGNSTLAGLGCREAKSRASSRTAKIRTDISPIIACYFIESCASPLVRSRGRLGVLVTRHCANGPRVASQL